MSSENNPYAAPGARVEPRPEPPPVALPAAADGPRGIGGWLLLPLFGLIATPFRMVFETVRDIWPALDPETWIRLTDPGSAAYHPIWAPLIVFELVANCLLIAFTLVLLWMFLKKSHHVPRLMITWILAMFGLQVVDMLLAAGIPSMPAEVVAQGARELTRSAVSALIWIPYFLRSRRVRNTFGERT